MIKRPKTEFGEYLVHQIKQAGMSQEAFYNNVGIKKPYFYDLITATPPPPELQNRMLAVLEEKTGKDPIRRNEFYNLAAKDRHEIPADIEAMIMSNIEEWNLIRENLAVIMNVHTSNID